LSNLRVYINPLDDNGAYTSYQEVTADVNLNSLSKISRKLDSSEYDVGVFSFSNLTIKLRNNHGKYSDVGTPRTIFKSRRNDSLVKIEWLPSPDEAILGAAIVGISVLGLSQEIFKGFLSDESLKSDIDTQEVNFTIRGMESLFDSVEVPFSSLSTGGGTRAMIADVMTVDEITDLLTISLGNIQVPDEQTIDNIDDFENTTVKDALNTLLEASNAVLYVSNDTVYVVPRDETAADPITFYGQASAVGIENLVKVSNIRSGRNKMFNYWKWSDTTLKATSTSSIDDFGVKDKEVDYSLFTNSTTKQNILDEFRDEFSEPKQEMEITVPMDYDSLDLFLLDRVNMDYPTVYMPAEPEAGLPLYGVAIYGESKYPLSQWSLNLTTDDIFKIIGIDLILKDNLVKLYIKRV